MPICAMPHLLLLPILLGWFCLTMPAIRAQSAAPELSQLETLSRKIDDQNAKIDALSQQILKLQGKVAQIRGETVGVPEATVAPATVAPAPGGGAAHVVSRGETLTSIARQYKVSIADL